MQQLGKIGRRIREVTIGGKEVAVSQDLIGFLGRVVWYSVYEVRVPHEMFLEFLDHYGVPEDLWPSKTRPVDAFKKAVRAQESKEYIVTQDIVQENGERTVIPNSMVVARRVRDDEISDIPVVVRAKYNEGQVFSVVKQDFPEAREIAEAIQKDYEFFQTTFDASDIRRFLNDAVKSALPIQLKASGGVYFVPEQYGELVEALSLTMEKLRELSPQTEFVTLPVIDRQPERATILYKYESETKQRIADLARRAIEWHKEGKELYPSQFVRLQGEYEWLLRQKAQYEVILETGMGKVETELDVLRRALGKLSENVKEKEG